MPAFCNVKARAGGGHSTTSRTKCQITCAIFYFFRMCPKDFTTNCIINTVLKPAPPSLSDKWRFGGDDGERNLETRVSGCQPVAQRVAASAAACEGVASKRMKRDAKPRTLGNEKIGIRTPERSGVGGSLSRRRVSTRRRKAMA